MATLARLARTEVEAVRNLGGERARALRRAGLSTVADLLMHVPRTYVDRSRSVPISAAEMGTEITVIGKVKKVHSRRPRSNLLLIEAVVSDGLSTIKAVWFNQSFRLRQLGADTEVALSGQIERYRGSLQMNSPDVDILSSSTESLITGRVVPIHPAVGKATPGVLRRAVHNALQRSRPVADSVPQEIRSRVGVVDRAWAFDHIHFPDTLDDVAPARRRLVFDELFRLEVALATQKKRQETESNGIPHRPDGGLSSPFLQGLPYRLTSAQARVLEEIRSDLARPSAMHRLLQGEVGSGKTVVAVAALLSGVEGDWQGAVMAPTEVLAEQHYLNISDLLQQAGLAPEPRAEGMDSLFGTPGPKVNIALLTRSRAVLYDRPGASREEVTEAIATGRAHLVVGTHALIQEGVEFHRLGVAVVDEQHRFGVAQRVELRQKGSGVDPDLLIMTATPIPRTLSMTLYGDLDVSTLDELPPGRTPVETIALAPADQNRAWDLVRRQVEEGRQAFVVCPLVEDSDKVEAASATAEHERLQVVLEGLRLGLIHGQLGPHDKERVMASFRDGDVDVLVSTTVIEVGIDVPNATVMVIEDADRFGLSQLHQLRGRVGRGDHGATCILMADPITPEGEERIRAMVETNDGFRLAAVDLELRGQGTVFGHRQSGMTDLRLADILADFELLETARREAFALVEREPSLEGRPELAEEIAALLGEDVEWLFTRARG